MKQRILKGWTFSRGVYLVLGLVVIVQAFTMEQWLGVLLGFYFASMGLFAFGCASGNCFSGNCKVEPKQSGNDKIRDIEFEEVK